MSANLSTQYQSLDSLDITIFKYRETFSGLDSQKLFLNPVCLVVLPYSSLELNAVSRKVLAGMLSVLNIANTSICTVWPAAHEDLKTFINGILELAAHSILILGDIFNTEETIEFHRAIDSTGCQRVNSFDPNTLAEKTEHKAAAYRDLLNLKNFIWGQG